jgi:hypothetical protein
MARDLNVEYQLRRLKSAVDPGATGYFQLDEVPANEYWLLHALHVFTSAPSTKWYDLVIQDTVTGIQMSVKTLAAAAQSGVLGWETPLPLRQSWRLFANITLYGAGDTVTALAFIRRVILVP